MKKYKSIILLLSFLFFLNCTHAENINIAVNLPMTGDIGIYGVQIKNGLILASKEVGFKDSKGRNFNFDWQDNKSSVKEANSVLMSQISSNPHVFITGLKPQFEAVKTRINKLGKPNFAWVWDPIMNNGKRGNDFQTWNNFRGEGNCIIDYINTKKIKKVVHTYVQLPSVEYQIEQILRPALKHKNIELITIPFSFNDTDLRSLVLKVKKLQPDFTIWTGFYNQIAIFIKETKLLKLINKENHYFSMDLLETDTLLNSKLINDTVTCVPNLYKVFNSNKLKKWRDNYKKEFNDTPSYHALYAYEQFKIIYNALSKIDDVSNNSEWLNQLYTTDINSISGRLQFDQTGSLITAVEVMRFKDNKFRKIDLTQS